ncbi:MAG: DUF6798 domain-containing protein [Rhodocyclaceae bacterium]
MILLALLACISAAFSWGIGFEYRWTGDTTETFYRIVRNTPADAERGGSLLTALAENLTAVVASQPLTHWYQGLFDAYLRSFHVAWNDISLAYKIQVLPLTLLYGVGAYFFFLHLTGKRWIAFTLAILALLPMPISWAGERAGLGPIWTYTRRYFLTAWLPILALLYYRGVLDNPKLLIPAVILVGATANLHSSGVILLQVLLLAYLLNTGISRKRVTQAIGLLGLGLCFSLTALGSLWTKGLKNISELILSAATGEAQASPLRTLIATSEKIPNELQYLFYPPKIYAQWSPALVDAWLLATIFLSLLPLIYRAKNREEQHGLLLAASGACLLFVSLEKMWVWVLLGTILYFARSDGKHPRAYVLSCYLLIANFWVAVVGMLLFQIGLATIEGFPLIFDQLRGIRFMGFWVFPWLATLAIPLLTNPGAISRPLRSALAFGLMVVVATTAQTFYRQYFRTLGTDHFAEKRDLLRMAEWAKRNTPTNAVFLVHFSSFGVVAERGVAVSDRASERESAEKMPPHGVATVPEAVQIAARYGATHAFLANDSAQGTVQECTLTTGQIYALMDVGCLRRIRE